MSLANKNDHVNPSRPLTDVVRPDPRSVSNPGRDEVYTGERNLDVRSVLYKSPIPSSRGSVCSCVVRRRTAHEGRVTGLVPCADLDLNSQSPPVTRDRPSRRFPRKTKKYFDLNKPKFLVKLYTGRMKNHNLMIKKKFDYHHSHPTS